jgi:hypothetical protein
LIPVTIVTVVVSAVTTTNGVNVAVVKLVVLE